VGGQAGTVVTRTIVGLLVVAAPIATAQAGESSLGEMAANVNQLVEPARRTELRLDASGVTSFPQHGTRFDVALEIAPRADYWYSIGAGTASTASTTTSITTGSDGARVSTTVSTTDSDVNVSVRIFKRIGPLVLSAGVLEDRPAVAVELRGWDDRVRFEVVDQSAGTWQVSGRPSIRVGGSLQLAWVYLQAGMQELLDGSLRAGYAGLGIRWKDADLRELLPWVAAR
jgi:phospholipid/cholesterol/gamma-HCH transport system substrate-binding protein